MTAPQLLSDLGAKRSIRKNGLIPALSRDLHQGPVLHVAPGRLSIEAGRLRAARPACRRYPTDKVGRFRRLF